MAQTLTIEANKEAKEQESLPPEDERVRYLKDCISSGKELRDKFTPTWEEIEKQIRLEPPPEWDNKEEWMTKVYLPQQYKASETTFSKLKKMLFMGKFFDAIGVEKKDREKVNSLMALLYALLDGGAFEGQNDSVLQESCDIGSGFLKVLINDTGDGLTFTWRSVHNCFFDPECGRDFSKARWWIDEYKKDIGYLIDDVQNPGNLYDIDKIQELLDEGVTQVTGKPDKGTVNIQSIDGTQSVTIPQAFKDVQIHEYWGVMKKPTRKQDTAGKWYDTDKYTYEWRVVTLANEKYIIRDHENIYGCIPVVMMKIKPLKYGAYGQGFLSAGRGLNDLMNSLINLGFDSLKISSMDIVILDSTKVADWETIEYCPKATWFMKDVNAAKFTRQAITSAISEILKGLNFLDAMHQEATNATRHAQGSMPLVGQGGSETLGEYQSKLAMIDEKFLIQGKLIETMYVKELINLLYRIVKNKQLFSQKTVNRILGMKEVEIVGQEPNAMTGQLEEVVRVQSVPKLVLSEMKDKMEYDFKIVGLTQMQELLEINTQIGRIMEVITQNPGMAKYIEPYALLKRLIQAIRIPDFEEILKSEEKVKQEDLLAFQRQQQLLLLQQQGGGRPAPARGGGGPPPIA